MLANNMLLLALASVATLVVAAPSEHQEHPEHHRPTATPARGEEGHARAFTMAAAPTGMVPHYIGKGVVAHMMPHDAEALKNVTWLDGETGMNLTKRRSNCNTLECDSGVYICSKENWKGSCYWQQAGEGRCHPYKYTRASSFGIDNGLQCALFQQGNCLYNQYTQLTWPGLTNLYGWPTWWNDKPLSYKCRPCVGCIYNKAPTWTINFSTD